MPEPSAAASERTGPRCPVAIRFGTTLHTRCALPAGHEGLHEGRGLRQFSYQVIRWHPGDRREHRTARDDEHAWED
jgi:hypothetical protein